MPELPEVEILRLQLTKLLVGQKIKDIQVLKKKSFVGDVNLAAGAEIIDVRRFGKLLVLDLNNGLSLAVHLKLTGQLVFRKTKNEKLRTKNKRYKEELIGLLFKELPNKHTRVVVSFKSGDRLFFNDMRIFGWLKIVQSAKCLSHRQAGKAQSYSSKLKTIDDLVKDLGLEPLKDLTLEKFKKILQSSKRPVKIVLMDQEKIAGVGNIYANEALFLAKVHPKTPANKITKKQAEVLYDKLLKVLKNGIKWKGASDQHFCDAYGRKGKFQEHFYVYGRSGEKCLKCGEKIKRIKIGGRGTFFCPKCQALL